ncbi:DMT family transporter [Pseudothermotoga thermarum]|uniref:EamA domain-containing protein n=1 Tax=Pseudothermotoga thermarum DSM 5069 TaxID=688269 RepID=F7YTS6_9THEM|nr:DMT family transporter [Pseudothermotoga thermarum]AEH51371.1 protein of unknown function DUF6 transmembrane [Pseudothermotoga thermarum DSM 5069]
MKRLQAIVLILLVTVVWGLTFPIQKIVIGNANPFFYNACRFAVATVLSMVVFRKKSNWKHGLILGFFLAISYATQTSGLKITSSTKSGFITSLYIPLVPLFSYFIERSRPTILQLAAFVSSILGLYLLNDPSHDPFNFGDFLTLICAVGFAIHVVLITHYTKNNDDEISLLVPQLFLTSVLNFLFTPIGGKPLGVSFGFVVVLVFTAIAATVFAVWVQLKYQKHVGSNTAALIYVGEPVFAAIFSAVILAERFSTSQLAGMAVLILSMIGGSVRLQK